jgi:uncharacterized membrane protein
LKRSAPRPSLWFRAGAFSRLPRRSQTATHVLAKLYQTFKQELTVPDYSTDSATPQPVQSGLSTNAAGTLAYVTIIPAIIFLVVDPYNKNSFVRFHSWQSIFLGIAAFAVDMVLSFIPIVGWILIPFVMLGFLIIWIMAMLKAYKGERWKLPVIGNLAEQQAGQ